MEISKGQIKQAAEILGNFSVAWFTAGIITPIFISFDFTTKFYGLMLISLTVGGFFAFISILLVKDIQS